MKWIVAVVGLALFLLGGLWFLQGTGLVVIEPIACVGECTALEGPSLPWALAGATLLLVGGFIVWFAVAPKRR